MSLSTTCPVPEEWRKFLAGEGGPERRAELAQHLGTCRQCALALQTISLPRPAQEPDTATGATPPSGRLSVESPHSVTRIKPASGVPSESDRAVRAWFDPPAAPDEIGRVGQYRILKKLGQGGMGVVYLAEDLRLRRPIALKFMQPSQAESVEHCERFLREARAMAAVKSDHIVTVHEVGPRETPFVAMEFLEGETLADLLKLQPRQPLDEVLRIGRETARALAAAHARGLIHRDIKPANLWLEAPQGRVKVLDFGLARGSEGDVTLTAMGAILGTPGYMAPEQMEGQAVDGRADLFSLGVVLYFLCTGEPPFQGASTFALMKAAAMSQPRPIQDVNPEVPPQLVRLVNRLLEKTPEQRPTSAAEVIAQLEAIDASRRPAPAPAAPPTIAPARPVLGAAIRIGVLHSRTGTMNLSEKPVIDAVLLAVEEINHQGGLLGRPLEAVVADGQSDETIFARQADRLITAERVCAIFGCWTSASRKAVKVVVERHDHMLYYPVQYEGLEQSPNIFYGGPVPNQQIIPALQWLATAHNRKRWFLVGSDYIFPRAANEIIRDRIAAMGCTVVGEEYILLGSGEVGEVIKKIQRARPELIVNTINGDTNLSFFRALRRAGITSQQIPTVSFSIAENELAGLAPADIEGDYAGWSYFESVRLPENESFLKRFRGRYGADRLVSDPMQAAYTCVYLWAEAVRVANTEDVRAVRAALLNQKLQTARGPVEIDPRTKHLSQMARVGRINKEGRFEEAHVSPMPLMPKPFPATRTPAEWQHFLDNLYRRWGQHWSNTGS